MNAWGVGNKTLCIGGNTGIWILAWKVGKLGLWLVVYCPGYWKLWPRVTKQSIDGASRLSQSLLSFIWLPCSNTLRAASWITEWQQRASWSQFVWLDSLIFPLFPLSSCLQGLSPGVPVLIHWNCKRPDHPCAFSKAWSRCSTSHSRSDQCRSNDLF